VEIPHGSNIALSKLTRVNGGVTQARPASASAARELLTRVESRLSADNAFLIRRIYGEGAWAERSGAEEVMRDLRSSWCPGCAALDDLVGAVGKGKGV
jgi:hypothetical protein